MKKILIERIHRTDDLIENLIKAQCMDEKSYYYGGMVDVGTGYAEPSGGVSIAGYFILRYCLPDSRFFDDDLFLERALIGLRYTLKRMHSDNTMDLTCTNPHDPTSIGFSVRIVAPAFRLLKKHMDAKKDVKPLEIEVYNTLIEFLTKSADGMVGNGFHTPNHRWVLASALALVMNILDMPELMDEINKYLDEGIDCDEYGEYAERSISIYNLTNNESLIILAHELNRPDLLEYVKRNLYMTTKYFEPDETLFTLNSTRQDVGTKTYPFVHFETFMVMAHLQNNSDFAYIAQYISNMSSNNRYDINNLGYYSLASYFFQHLEYTDHYSGNVEIKPFDFTHFNSFFPNSDIARIRDGDAAMTVLAKNTILMKYIYKFFSIHFKFLANSFLECDEIEKTSSGYRLYGKDDKVELTIDFNFLEDGVDIVIDTKCDQPYPCAASLMFDKEGMLNSKEYSLNARLGNNLIVKNNTFKYSHLIAGYPHAFDISSDFGDDDFSSICVNKAMPTDKDVFTVLLSAQAPFKKKISIRNS